MTPIPRRLLIHSGTLKTSQTKDRWGTFSGGSDVDLKFIRFDPSDKLVQTAQNQELKLTGLVFYDARNSRPRNVTFERDQTINILGEDRRIVTIDKLYDGKRLHHYELGVV